MGKEKNNYAFRGKKTKSGNQPGFSQKVRPAAAAKRYFKESKKEQIPKKNKVRPGQEKRGSKERRA